MEPYPLAQDDVPASQIYLGKDVRKQGMLRKKTGGMKIPLLQNKYDHRFVIINKGWVYYYKDKSSEKPQGKFSLQGFSSTVINAEEEEALMPHVFKIYSKKMNERTWFFATENEVEKREWMEAFRLEIEQYNVRGISNIRPSKSCPVNPNNGLSRPDINNGRPQSVHVPPRVPTENLPRSQLSSNTNLTEAESGIFSSNSSLDPDPNDDVYEPVEDDDEFDTDTDSEYEVPLFEEEEKSPVCFPTNRTQHVPYGALPNPPQPPALPPRDPVVPSLTPTHSPPGPLASELRSRMPLPEFGSQTHSHAHSIPSPPKHSPPTLERKPAIALTIPQQYKHPGINRPQPGSEQARFIRHMPKQDDPSRRVTTAATAAKRHSAPVALMHEMLSKMGLPSTNQDQVSRRPLSMAAGFTGLTEECTPGTHHGKLMHSPKGKMPLPPLPEPTSSHLDDLPSLPPPVPPNSRNTGPPLPCKPWSRTESSPAIPSFAGSHTPNERQNLATLQDHRMQFSPPLPARGEMNVQNAPPRPAKPLPQPPRHSEQYYVENYNDASDMPAFSENTIKEADPGYYDLPMQEPEPEPVSEAIYTEEIPVTPPPTPPMKPNGKPPVPPVGLKPGITNIKLKPASVNILSPHLQTHSTPGLESRSKAKTVSMDETDTGARHSNVNTAPWKSHSKTPGFTNAAKAGRAAPASKGEGVDDNKPSWLKPKLKPTMNAPTATTNPSGLAGPTDGWGKKVQNNVASDVKQFTPGASSINPPSKVSSVASSKPSWVKDPQNPAASKFKNSSSSNTPNKPPWQTESRETGDVLAQEKVPSVPINAKPPWAKETKNFEDVNKSLPPYSKQNAWQKVPRESNSPSSRPAVAPKPGLPTAPKPNVSPKPSPLQKPASGQTSTPGREKKPLPLQKPKPSQVGHNTQSASNFEAIKSRFT